MKLKWLAPALGALTIIGLTGIPAEAGSTLRRDSNYRQRNERQIGENPRSRQLGSRADAIARRARELHRQGRLSADHRDRTIEKLQRVRSDARDGDREGRSRVQANDRYLDQVENTLNEWSRADSRNLRNNRNNRDYRVRPRR
ncbi:MAG: hypothetical protein ACO1SX_06125 [Actinomycetota bacterium]